MPTWDPNRGLWINISIYLLAYWTAEQMWWCLNIARQFGPVVCPS